MGLVATLFGLLIKHSSTSFFFLMECRVILLVSKILRTRVLTGLYVLIVHSNLFNTDTKGTEKRVRRSLGTRLKKLAPGTRLKSKHEITSHLSDVVVNGAFKNYWVIEVVRN